LLELDLPAFQPERVDAPPQALIDGLGLGMAGWESWRNFENYYVVLPTEAALRAVAPNMAALQALHPLSVCVTAAAGESKADHPDLDFVSRYFAPSHGIPEDPMTGSVHATLAPLWAEHLGKTRLRARQLSARGGAWDCECLDGRVLVRGQAKTYLRGTLELGDTP
jgi:predicted PhzF superfamily epimerase YddE/YHI9